MDMKIKSDDFVFLPLGGSGEIGMNANLYHYKERWLMVDLGISLPDESMPGVDVVLPDLRFIEARKDKLEAIILTHAHEDHFGAIPYLWKRLGVPVYGTAFTLALLRRKLAESRLDYKIPLHELDFIAYDFDRSRLSLCTDPFCSIRRLWFCDQIKGPFFILETGNLMKRQCWVLIQTETGCVSLGMRACSHLLGIQPMPWLTAIPRLRRLPETV